MVKIVALMLLVALSLPDPANAQARGLEGSWSGGGSVVFASGAREQVRCRVRYTRTSEISYVANATCATPSGRASQTAILRRATQNSYRGRFHNSEYNISGLIFVILRGNTQNVRLTSENGSAFIRLSR